MTGHNSAGPLQPVRGWLAGRAPGERGQRMQPLRGGGVQRPGLDMPTEATCRWCNADPGDDA